jgi:DNA polymerase-3 subunit gamma/tau
VLAGQLPAAPQPATATRPTAASPPVQANRSVATIVTAPPAVQTASPNKTPQITPFRDRTKPGITTPSPASSVTSLGASAADTEPSGPLGKPIEVDAELWPETLNNLKKTYNTLYGIARMAQPTFYADAVELGFTFAFHKKRLSEPKNREIIAAAIKQVSGKDMGVRCILLSKNGNPFDEPLPTSSAPSNADSSQQSAANAEQNTPAPDISAISNIFGGAEVLPG